MGKRSKKSRHSAPAVVSQPSGPLAISAGAPYMPDGTGNYGMYDAVAFSTNRQNRPYFATDSKFTLNSWSRLRAMALARWAYGNVSFVKGATDLKARLSVGSGFSPSSHCSDTGLAKAYDDYYQEKTRNIGFQSGESMDELLLHDSRSIDVDGDLGFVMTEDEQREAKLQTIESHRIKNGDVTDPACRDGIWCDQYGRKAAFNVELPGEEGKTRRIEARDFIYLAERNRPDELRSMTNFIHALAPLQDLYELIGFTMQSAKKNSEYAALIETATPNTPPGIGPNFDQVMRQAMGGVAPQPDTPQQRVTREQVYGSGGKIPVLRPGESFKSYFHNQPSPTIEQWAEFIIRGIAVGFGMPFEVLWNPEKLGGTSNRMVLGLLAKSLDQRNCLLKREKLNRVRFWILARGIKRRELKPSPGLFNVTWNPNFSDLTIDAGRDSRERRNNVIAGLDTFTQYASENGQSYPAMVSVRKDEIALQCAAAQELCTKYKGLSFEAALARIALLTQNAAEIQPSMTRPDPKP